MTDCPTARTPRGPPGSARAARYPSLRVVTSKVDRCCTGPYVGIKERCSLFVGRQTPGMAYPWRNRRFDRWWDIVVGWLGVESDDRWLYRGTGTTYSDSFKCWNHPRTCRGCQNNPHLDISVNQCRRFWFISLPEIQIACRHYIKIDNFAWLIRNGFAIRKSNVTLQYKTTVNCIYYRSSEFELSDGMRHPDLLFDPKGY